MYNPCNTFCWHTKSLGTAKQQ